MNRKIPPIGYGTCEIKDSNMVKTAIDLGYRLIDTASHYYNEDIVGQGLRDSNVSREEIIIQTKLWYSEMGDYDKVRRAAEESLKKLGVSQIDVYLIHWPAASNRYNDIDETNKKTWQAMEKLVDERIVKKIGLCNFTKRHLNSIYNGGIKHIEPAINQIEIHPGFIDKELIEICNNRNIIVEAWSPLGTGEVLNNGTICEIASKKGVTAAQICLAWVRQHGCVSLPKSSTKERMRDNLLSKEVILSNDEVIAIDKLKNIGGQCAVVRES